MVNLGPFFWIDNKLLYAAAPMAECERRLDKLDNPAAHVDLFETKYNAALEYQDYPRGRVIYDTTNSRAIIYIDKCINNETVIGEIVKAFSLETYVVDSDGHYQCKNCLDIDW